MAELGVQIQGPRGTRREELGAVMGLVNKVFAAEKRGDMYARFPVLFADENLDNCRILLAGARPVSHVAYLVRDVVLGGPRARAACIGAVCTDEAYRGRGLASRILDDCERRMRDQQVDVICISGTRNLYERRGARTVSVQRSYVLSPHNTARLADDSIDCRPAGPDAPEVLARLYDASPVRHVRSEQDWRRWLLCGRCENAPAQPYVGLQRGQTAVYVAHKNKNLGMAPISAAGEWAGAPAAVAAVFAWLARTQSLLPLTVVADAVGDRLLIQRMEDAGIPSSPANFGRCVLVLRPGALFDELRSALPSPACDLRVIERPEVTRFQLGDESLDVPRDELARLFFGDPGGLLAGKLNSAGTPGRALLAAFPVPLPRYGYNYT